MSSAASGNIRGNRRSQLVDRHGLEIHLTGTGDDGIEEAFSAKQNIFDAADALNGNLAGFAHCGKVTCVDDQLLTGLKGVFDD